ncbi:SDR family oxidoreductase [Nonomuraea sp. K274]|uniref:SDR family oxidoreductase n=1 Tax=Nonomuraea cypriaca TaxID=1187855 RepID=A0A931EYE3_9ACTN|nr:SDR family oxidoreductase [Nonomuraea cypriaca]MBF8188689.1 SDR family oxidoreductase [Nonomuraea cypriaca]
MELSGSIALVTGANRGIGREFARQLLDRGAAKVYATARDATKITVPGVEALSLDITDPDAVAAAAEKAGDVTLLVNNAGIANAEKAVTGDLSRMRAEMETNVFGTLSMIRAFAPVLARHGGGAIANVLSAASWFTYPGSSSYAMSKAAEWSLTNGVRMELQEQGTLVTGVHVGMVDTDMSASLDVEKISAADFVKIVLDELESGPVEIVADDLSRRAKASVAEEPSLFVP